ncbi:agmatinase [Cryomorpha ignava]|uniref:Agmatinase n=1 Tax=Cryomorpha ignava TaxID=101383 RepID=A0A7K3WV54_9FLAO|nr:agmatinase [Cryomorpha ignava]NEN25569.1 agmatinase [Cryomorpha ignava]
MEEYPNNFGGIPNEYARLETAKVVVIPVPYDGTSTWQKGADEGPAALLDAARNMELYDIETGTEVYQEGIYLAPPVTENESPEAMVEAVYKTVASYLEKGKMVTALGGEHSISIGVIRAYMEKYKELTILQIDAHADLRESYEGSKCNHACAVYEANQKAHLVQVGIRSMDVSENKVMKRENVFFAHEMATNSKWMNEAIDRMTRDVFITIDLDAFDPSIMPSTGTPEPGGMQWYETLKFIRKVNKKRNIVGFDIVELMPNAEEKSSDFLAAKLYYKILTYIFKKKNKKNG